MSTSTTSSSSALNVLMIGTGEYTTGYVHGQASDSDKSAGVVALTMLDLRQRGKCNRLAICGVNGTKFQGIRNHMQKAIGDVYTGLDPSVIETFPNDNEIKPDAYLDALETFQPGDCVTIFTPDDTHFEIALACVEKGLHVLVTKPAVKTLSEHRALYEAAKRKNVLVMIEVHKRFDPMYIDAKDKIVESFGPFSYMYSYMSQPKHQLDTFRAWAGKSSDISYYLNSHHIDFHEWCAHSTMCRPVKVNAIASTGVATGQFDINTEDTITLTVEWENLQKETITTNNNNNNSETNTEVKERRTKGTGIYTSSWIAPKSDVHSQQRFFYMGQGGEINIDQAHRGYNMSIDNGGYRSVNPLFMKYTPSNGYFSGQKGYGYVSFEEFINAVTEINSGKKKVEDYDGKLATIGTTFLTTAILEAGRRSLDANGHAQKIEYDENENFSLHPLDIVAHINN